MLEPQAKQKHAEIQIGIGIGISTGSTEQKTSNEILKSRT